MVGYNDTITVKRLAEVDGQKKYTTVVYTNLGAIVLQVGPDRAPMISNGNPYTTFIVTVDGIKDIKENDEITNAAGLVFRVTGVHNVYAFIKKTIVTMSAVV